MINSPANMTPLHSDLEQNSTENKY